MKIINSIKKYTIYGIVCLIVAGIALSMCLIDSVNAEEKILPEASYNLESSLIDKSYLTTTSNGYMRVFYNGEKIGIEYYDDSFNIQSIESIEMELDLWGGFYEGSDSYYLIQGTANKLEDYDAEVVRVIKYDKNWNRKGAASITGDRELWGGEVRYPFDYGCVQATEYNGYLYIVTGHEGYVDSTYNQGHQGFLMITVDINTMEGMITDGDYWHSFAQYIKNRDSELYVLEQSEGSRYTKLSRYEAAGFDTGESIKSFPVLAYGGSRDSAWAIKCYASVDGMALSQDNVLCVGTSIDQSEYDNITTDTPHNIYLTVTSMTEFSEETTNVKWLTNYTGGGKSFTGLKITHVNDNRFMISWEEYNSEYADLTAPDISDSLSANTLHYMFIDGNGNKLSDEFTANAAISDCQPIVKDLKIVYYASNGNMVNFYSIDSVTGEFSKKTYRIAGKNAEWNIVDGVLTISGTGAVATDNTAHPYHSLSTVSSMISYSSSDNAWMNIRDNVEKIIIKTGITSIGEEQFSHFLNLKEVVLEDGVESIGNLAFYNCDSLSKITIPASVTEIGEDILWTGSYWVSDESHVVRATIYTTLGSYAEEYADENNISVIRIAIKGDVNSDGILNSADAVILKKYLLGENVEINMEASDLYGDEKINIFDLMVMKRIWTDLVK